MKTARVVVTSTAVAVVLLFLALVPVPMSRIRGLALVQAIPENSSQISLRRTSLLQELKVAPGDHVTKGQVLATFRDPDLEEKASQARAELQNADEALKGLEKNKSESVDPREKQQFNEEIIKTIGRREVALATLKSFKRVQQDDLIILAPRDGIVGQAPKPDDIGKLFEGSREQQQAQPIFTIHEEGKIRVCMPLTTSDFNRLSLDYRVQLAKNEKSGKDESLWVNMRVHGLDSSTWRGSIERLDESEAKFIPVLLSSRANGPVAVQAPNGKTQGLVPQTQHYLVYINIHDPDPAITVGAKAQVKIYLQPETCLHWAWRTINDVFNPQLM